MTAAEKNQLYSHLRIISAWAQGYPSASFNGEIPDFTDDQEAPQEQVELHQVESQEVVSAPQVQTWQHQVVTQEEISRRQEAIAKLEAQIKQCQRCKLCKGRTQAVPGTGILNPAVLVIGEGPGADEDAQGLPFVGVAGQLLDKMLAAINLSRNTNCYIANIVKCRPPKNRDPEPEESDACRSYLEAQIAILKPAMILAVGRIAIQNLLQTSQGIGQLRGKILSYNNIPLMATYHPSALLRTLDLKRPAWEDLKVFRTHLTQIHP
ncbi:MAG: uracil-DNA glycosylase, partial [Spirochaetaceae bacterium]|nr:uracil-DNA glycosylase [Spirochaetaceae bacterium]